MARFLTEPLWGYIRGVRFQYIEGTTILFDAHFETGHGKITYVPKTIWDENDDYELIPNLIGFRPVMDIDLRNYRVDEFQQFQQLYNMLTHLVYNPNDTEVRKIKIYPRYTAHQDAVNIHYDSFLKSNVALDDFSDFIEVMQTQKIQFIGLALTQHIPTTTQFREEIIVPGVTLGSGATIETTGKQKT